MSQGPNPEFAAFQAVYDALVPLDDEARRRVVKSVIMLLAINAPVSEPDDDITDAEEEVAAEQAAQGAPTYASFAELHAAASPTTNSDRALVAGYWIQVCQNNESFTAQAANKELMHLGHKVANITSAIDVLRNSSPQLILQLKKSGSSQQARKTYKVSVAGVRRVEEMIHG